MDVNLQHIGIAAAADTPQSMAELIRQIDRDLGVALEAPADTPVAKISAAYEKLQGLVEEQPSAPLIEVLLKVAR